MIVWALSASIHELNEHLSFFPFSSVSVFVCWADKFFTQVSTVNLAGFSPPGLFFPSSSTALHCWLIPLFLLHWVTWTLKFGRMVCYMWSLSLQPASASFKTMSYSVTSLLGCRCSLTHCGSSWLVWEQQSRDSEQNVGAISFDFGEVRLSMGIQYADLVSETLGSNSE